VCARCGAKPFDKVKFKHAANGEPKRNDGRSEPSNN
jgi:hypothetical protein